ncbi:MAG: hypothetical protein ACYCU7_18755 [Acidimicrobiales bacterium]
MFSENKIVSDTRRNQILRDLRRRDAHFFCHKGTIVGREVVCHGSYESMPQMVRIAGRLGVIVFVDPDTLEKTESASGKG